MSANVKVSIIVPVYNVSAYIERCLQSIIKQTYENIECIIIDDATTDDSMLKCERMIEEYNGPINFVTYSHHKNRGLSAARNTGTDLATGDYLLYLDSDDELREDSIEKLLSPVLKNDGIEMVVGNFEPHSDGCPLPFYLRKIDMLPEMELCSRESVRDLFFRKKLFPLSAWNKLIKKAFVKEFALYFKEGVLYEDRLWTFYVLKYLSHLYIVPYVTYLYYVRPSSITTGTKDKVSADCRGAIYNEIGDNLTSGEEGKEANFYVREICSCLIRYPNNPAIIHSAGLFRKVLRVNHYTFKAVILYILICFSKTELGRIIFRYALKIRNILG